MAEAVIGAAPNEVVSSFKTKEGSLSFAYSNSDFLANSVGHVMAIPTRHIPLLTLRDIFRNPKPELVDFFKDRWKDVPWKGDVLVRIGHNSIFGDIQRLFANDQIRGPLSLGKTESKALKSLQWLVRLLVLPSVVFSALQKKLFRGNYYNTLTNTVNIFHPNTAIGMHEIGHAEFYNQEKNRTLYALFGGLPIIRSFTEYKASMLGIARMKNDAERLKATKVMEAMWGTYLMGDVIALALPFLAITPLTTALVASKKFTLPFGPDVLKRLLEFGYTAGVMAGAAAGHILSRAPYPGRRQRFGYVFEGKKVVPKPAFAPALSDRQMLVGMARPQSHAMRR